MKKNSQGVTHKTMLECFIMQAIIDHPLPWKTEQDWMTELVASDGVIVVKCSKEHEARAIIEFAEKWQTRLDEDIAMINANFDWANLE